MLESIFLRLNPFAPWLDAASMLGSMFFVPPSDQRIEKGGVDAFAMTECNEDYSLFVPPRITRANPPMVVMLHGASQDPADFAAGTAMNEAASRLGFIVLYPAQSNKFNPHRCWNWFDPKHQGRSQGEPARLAKLTMEVAGRCGVDKRRVYVAGLSSGGAMAALLGELFPELFAAVGVHSGLAPLVANDLATAFTAMRGEGRRSGAVPSGMPTIVFHGDRDATVHYLNGEQIIDACVGPDSRTESSVHAGSDGRRFTRRSFEGDGGRTLAEHWTLHGATHAWSGGRVGGTFADPLGPDASGEMLRFFCNHQLSESVGAPATIKRHRDSFCDEMSAGWSADQFRDSFQAEANVQGAQRNGVAGLTGSLRDEWFGELDWLGPEPNDLPGRLESDEW